MTAENSDIIFSQLKPRQSHVIHEDGLVRVIVGGLNSEPYTMHITVEASVSRDAMGEDRWEGVATGTIRMGSVLHPSIDYSVDTFFEFFPADPNPDVIKTALWYLTRPHIQRFVEESKAAGSSSA